MTLEEFVAHWDGQQCCDGGLCQCEALMNAWIDSQGWSRPRSSPANTAATLEFDPPWHQVKAPAPGDVVIFNAQLPGSGGAGHVDVYLSPLRPGFRGFDQHWDDQVPGTFCHQVDHTSWELPYIQAFWRWSPPPAPPPDPTEVTDVQAQDLYDALTLADPGYRFGATPGDQTGPGYPAPAGSWAWRWCAWYRAAHPELNLPAGDQHTAWPSSSGWQGEAPPAYSWCWRFTPAA